MIVVRFTNGDFQQFPGATGWTVQADLGTIAIAGPQTTPGVVTPAGTTDPLAAVTIALAVAAHVNSIAFAADPTPAPVA